MRLPETPLHTLVSSPAGGGDFWRDARGPLAAANKLLWTVGEGGLVLAADRE